MLHIELQYCVSSFSRILFLIKLNLNFPFVTNSKQLKLTLGDYQHHFQYLIFFPRILLNKYVKLGLDKMQQVLDGLFHGQDKLIHN